MFIYSWKWLFFHVPVLAKLWPVIGRATQVAKKEVFYWFPFGLACWLWGTLFINRENNSAQTAINKQSKAITERNVWKCNWNFNLFIFFQYFYDFVCSRKFCSSLRELETHQVSFYSLSDFIEILMSYFNHQTYFCLSKKDRFTWQCKLNVRFNLLLCLAIHS